MKINQFSFVHYIDFHRFATPWHGLAYIALSVVTCGTGIFGLAFRARDRVSRFALWPQLSLCSSLIMGFLPPLLLSLLALCITPSGE